MKNITNTFTHSQEKKIHLSTYCEIGAYFVLWDTYRKQNALYDSLVTFHSPKLYHSYIPLDNAVQAWQLK